MHQKLKLISSARKTQMFSLQLQDVNGRWQVTDKRDEIEQALHDYIAIHFEQPQMDICPLMMDHYLDVFGHDIYTCQGRSLNSSREINFPFNISPLEESIFEELKPLDLSNITAWEKIPFQDIKQGYLKWKECTLTSPHGWHLGIYKVWLWESELEIEERKKYWDQPENNHNEKLYTMYGDKFFQIITDIINLALQFNHPLHRWKWVNVLMAPKDLEIPKPNRIRYLN